jgi:RNA polymerase-binding transcription factor DksA
MDEIDLVNDLTDRAMERFVRGRVELPKNPITWCLECGLDIGAERLKILPHTKMCVHCQALMESNL